MYSLFNQNWSEDSEDEDGQHPLSREDSGIQVDRTPLEEQDQNRKLGPCVSWKGTLFSQMHHFLMIVQARFENQFCVI